MYRLEAVEEPPDVVLSKRMKRLLKNGAFSDISQTSSDWSIADELRQFGPDNSISLLSSESPSEKEKCKGKEKSVHFKTVESIGKSAQAPIVSKIDTPSKHEVKEKEQNTTTHSPLLILSSPSPTTCSQLPLESHLSALFLIVYLLLIIASPFLPNYFADVYRGNRPPIPNNPQGSNLYNRLLHQRGFDGKLHPSSSLTNFRPVVQPRAKLLAPSGIPLVELNILAPADGLLVHSNVLVVELKGALLQIPWSSNARGAEHDSDRSGAVLKDRHARLRVMLDQMDFSYLGSERFVVPYDYSSVMTGGLGPLKNGLHHLEVTVDLVDLQGAGLGLLQNNYGGNTTVSTTVVFYFFRPENVSSSLTTVDDQAVERRFESAVDTVSASVDLLSPVADHALGGSGSDAIHVTPIRFLAPVTDSWVAQSFNVSVAAMHAYLIPTEYLLVLRFDNQIHDVTHLTNEADSLGRFNLEIHGAARGGHSITLSALRYHRDSATGLSGEELKVAVEQGQVVGSDTLQVDCR